MCGTRIADLCLSATSGTLRYSQHYTQNFLSHATPSRDEIRFLLCDDAPEVIEDYPQRPKGSRCLIWGTTDGDSRIGHVVCANPPDSTVVTAYFPAETEPDKWEDNYRRRIRG